MDQSGIIPYRALQQKLDPMIPPSVNCYGTALYFDKLEGETLQVFLSFMDEPSSPGVLGQMWYMALDDEDTVCEMWINDLYAGLRPYAHKIVVQFIVEMRVLIMLEMWKRVAVRNILMKCQ